MFQNVKLDDSPIYSETLQGFELFDLWRIAFRGTYERNMDTYLSWNRGRGFVLVGLLCGILGGDFTCDVCLIGVIAGMQSVF